MEKNVQIELQLSEEQLQEITGGCAQCVADLAQITHNEAQALARTALAQEAGRQAQNSQLLGDKMLHLNEAQTQLNLADAHVQVAQKLTTWVVARGHV